MSHKCTEHTRRDSGATCDVCKCPIVPGDRYRWLVIVYEEYTEDLFYISKAHSWCVHDCDWWELREPEPPWKPPKPAPGVTVKEHRVLLHCLGMGEHIDRQYHGSRHSGYFADGSPVAESLVAKGMMARARKRPQDDDSRYYLVTRAGGAAVGRPDLGVST